MAEDLDPKFLNSLNPPGHRSVSGFEGLGQWGKLFPLPNVIYHKKRLNQSSVWPWQERGLGLRFSGVGFRIIPKKHI